MAEPRDLRRILREEVGLDTTDRVWPILQRELPTLLQRARDADGELAALRQEVHRLQEIEAVHGSLRLAARVLVDELHDAWWVRAAGALRALEASVPPSPLAADPQPSVDGGRSRPAASGADQ